MQLCCLLIFFTISADFYSELKQLRSKGATELFEFVNDPVIYERFSVELSKKSSSEFAPDLVKKMCQNGCVLLVKHDYGHFHCVSCFEVDNSNCLVGQPQCLFVRNFYLGFGVD